MNTKEQFGAHLEANSIHYEKVNGMILFEFEDHYLVAKDFWKKGFRIGIPYALTADEEPTNSDNPQTAHLLIFWLYIFATLSLYK